MRQSERFSFDMNFRDALALYIFFRGREEELAGTASALSDRIRDFLYDRLSIEEMERPEELLSRLDREA